jgi:aminoglycoside phosphotransferase (APT) family kinase protein
MFHESPSNEERTRVEVQDTDPGTAALSESFDPIALARHLRLFSLPPWNWGTVETVEVGILRRKAERRCTLELTLRTESGSHSIIGKVYASDRSDVFAAMKQIEQAGFGSQDEFSIPQPLAYLHSLRLLVQERVEGPRAKEIFTTGDELSRAAAAERCARWLARLHTTAPKAGTVLHPRDLFKSNSMHQYARETASLGGRFADKIARLLDRLDDAVSSLSPVEMRAGHGSYGAAHVIPAAGRTVVFDWDGYDVADPARDVGRFLASLRHVALGRLGSIRALDGTAEVFLRTYQEVGQLEVKTNLRFYEGAACLKLGKHCLYHARLNKMEATLDEGLRILEQGTIP